jgi:hypothetical protein
MTASKIVVELVLPQKHRAEYPIDSLHFKKDIRVKKAPLRSELPSGLKLLSSINPDPMSRRFLTGLAKER